MAKKTNLLCQFLLGNVKLSVLKSELGERKSRKQCQFLLGNVKQLNLSTLNNILPFLFHKIKHCA